MLVPLVVAFLVFTAVYLKSSSVVPPSNSTPVVKIWADPDPASDKTVKIISIVFLPLVVFVVLVLAMGERGSELFRNRVPALKTYLVAPVWLRPPPLQ